MTDEVEAIAREARANAARTWSSFESLGDRLDELRSHVDDDDDVDEAFRELEGLVTALDDVVGDATAAVEGYIDD